MIAVLSPAKSLDMESEITIDQTNARFEHQTDQLIEVLKQKSESEIQNLMSLSEKLASLNVERYHAFKSDHSLQNARPCILTFKGDVYQGLDAWSLKKEEIDWSQHHLRILSGLYGLLRPKDLIQPYRLEMGTKLRFDTFKNLYDFWGNQITKLLNEDLKKQGDDLVINLASVEYFSAIKKNELEGQIIDVDFQDFKNGQYKTISFYAKKARGLMARYIIEHQINKAEDLKGFDYANYSFDHKSSQENHFVFKRG
jgi:hypothetical protein